MQTNEKVGSAEVVTYAAICPGLQVLSPDFDYIDIGYLQFPGRDMTEKNKNDLKSSSNL